MKKQNLDIVVAQLVDWSLPRFYSNISELYLLSTAYLLKSCVEKMTIRKKRPGKVQSLKNEKDQSYEKERKNYQTKRGLKQKERQKEEDGQNYWTLIEEKSRKIERKMNTLTQTVYRHFLQTDIKIFFIVLLGALPRVHCDQI